MLDDALDVSYIACMSLVALSAGILNAWKTFAVPALHAGAAEWHDRLRPGGARRGLARRGLNPFTPWPVA